MRDYVMQGGTAAEFLEKLMDLLRFLIPRYEQEGKNQLVIAVGCTGGKHRSVAIAHEVFKRLKEAERVRGATWRHRDADVDGVRIDVIFCQSQGGAVPAAELLPGTVRSRRSRRS